MMGTTSFTTMHGFIGLCIALTTVIHLARGQTDEEMATAIDTFVQDLMVSEEMVGSALAVVREGRPLMAEGYGVKDLVEQGQVTNDTLFYLASCGKAMNAALVSKVISEDGRYDFDTYVREIYPEFAASSGFRSEHATIRDLLAHRTGQVDSIYMNLCGAMESREDFMSRSRFFPATSPFRDQESYNNVMVTIGGHLVEILTGQEWENAMIEQILDPLGMTQTTFIGRMTPEQYEAMATGHEPYRGEPREVSKTIYGPQISAPNPTGGEMTCATDMQKWLLFLTNKGLAEDGSRVMNESDLMRTMTETSNVKSNQRFQSENENPLQPIIYKESGVALGWYNGLYRGYNMVTHLGYYFGFLSKVTVLYDLGMGVYTNINCPDGFVNGSFQLRVHEYALDTLLGLSPSGEDYMGSQQNYGSPDHDILESFEDLDISDDFLADAVSAERFEDDEPVSRQKTEYTGTYGNFVFANATVFYNETEDRLWLEYGSVARLDLYDGEVADDTFVGNAQEPLWFAPPINITFSSSDGVTIDQMTIPFLMPQAPPTFIRGLLLSDAPPPADDSCEDP